MVEIGSGARSAAFSGLAGGIGLLLEGNWCRPAACSMARKRKAILYQSSWQQSFSCPPALQDETPRSIAQAQGASRIGAFAALVALAPPLSGF